MSLGRHSLCREMSQLGFREVMRFLESRTDTYSVVSVLLHGLVMYDLIHVELQDCTRYALAGLSVVYCRHAYFSR